MADEFIYGVFFKSTDGCTYDSEDLLGVFSDLDLAFELAEKKLKENYPDDKDFRWNDDMNFQRFWENKPDEYRYTKIEILTVNKERQSW